MSTVPHLARSASRGAVSMMAGQGARVVVQTASVIVLARLLAPNDYGLIAEVLAIVGLAEIVRDFGLSNAAVQAKTLSEAERNNLFWVNTLIGVGLMALAIASSPLIALLYHEPRLVPLTFALSFAFLLNGMSTQLRADLNRSLRFGALARSEVSGQVIGLLLGLGMALLGYGYWALAGQQIAQSAATLTLLWISTRLRPRRYRRDVSVRRFLKFGLDVVGAQLLGYASKNTDTVIIGSTIGATPLGYYNRAFQLLTLPLSQINAPATRVAVSVLSKLQDDKAAFDRYLLAGQAVMLNVVLAVFAWTSALAYPLIHLVLGPQWDTTVTLFQILAISGVFSTAGYATYWVFLARGLTRTQLWWQVASRPVFVGIVITGSLWGVVGVATAYSAASAVMWVFGLVWSSRTTEAPAFAMFRNGARAMVGHALAALAAALVIGRMPADALLAQIGVGTLVWAAALTLIALLWPGFRADILSIRVVLRLLRRRSADALSRQSPVTESPTEEPAPAA